MDEKQNIEWKEIWKDEYLAWICGFANAQGGKLYIGVSDRGDVVGIDNSDKLLQSLPSKIRDAMGIVVNINLLYEQDKKYLEIVVPSYHIAISCKGNYYYRSGSTTQTLSGVELENFILNKRGVTWDNMPIPFFTIDDVDDYAILNFKEWASKKERIDKSIITESKEILLEKLHLKNGDYYTNAAMLLFSKDPEKWQLGAYTKVGFFESDADLIYQDEIRGSLFEQANKVIELIYFKYMKANIKYHNGHREEHYFVPEDALREAILNALVHKNYASGIPIQISVYQDHLYIANSGKLPESWSVEKLFQKHPSTPFNPNIANAFYLAGFIESWGRGIEKICNCCKEKQIPIPEFIITPGDIMIKFIASEYYLVTPKYEVNDGVSDGVTDRVTDGVTDRLVNKIEDNEKGLVKLLLANGNYSYTELSSILGLSRKSIAKRMKSLKDKQIIERIGSTKKGYWKVNLDL